MIKAIETSYKGYRFRSRLEARWAVFFDAMGLDWSYETEGFTLPSGEWYLPDFKIKGDDESIIWIEVKGGFDGYLSPVDGWSKVNNFSSHAVKVNGSVCVLGDIPDPNSREIIEPQKNMVISKPNGNGEWQRFCFVLNEYENKELYPSIITNKVSNGQKEVGFMGGRYRIWWPENAYRMARSSRFEHGESGAPNTTPTDTGVPQRGAGRRKAPKPERRTDQMSVRMRPSIRALVEQLAEEEGVPIAEVIERAVSNFAGQK
jgi:hypothetical protein